MKRWQRPSGELWIVKNRAEPETRLGYESYSAHSQYNLLPAAMLCMAYEHADDAIAERPIPAESGAYVFDLRETFHKVAAAAGGYYALIDTNGDPHYNATGLQRIHRAGVALSPLSDSTAPESAYGPKDAPKIAMAPGIRWRTSTDAADKWTSLASASAVKNGIKSATLTVTEQTPARVGFELVYSLGDKGAQVIEQYRIDADGVTGTSTLHGAGDLAATSVLFPALVNDGKEDTNIAIEPSRATIGLRGSKLTFEVTVPAGLPLKLVGPEVPSHNGYMQALAADLPDRQTEVRWHISLQNEK
jgi:hypothetical protein